MQLTNTILIIDDNEDDILLTKRALSRTATEIATKAAASGVTGLTLLNEAGQLPSLIFLDLKMQGMSGLDVLREIRADARTRHIPVIVVTSSSLESDEKDAREAGADGFIHKALDMDQFSENINFILDRWIRK
jgi:two-component system response regulator